MALITGIAIDEASQYELTEGGQFGEDFYGKQVIEAARELLAQQSGGKAAALPLGEFFERPDDMGQGRLRLILDGDSDVSLAVITHEGEMADVEFCTPFSGGGRSPKVREALLDLCRAIQTENASNPILDFRADRKVAASLAPAFAVIMKSADDAQWLFCPGELYFDQDVACQRAYVLAGAGDSETQYSAAKIDRAGVVPVGETHTGVREV
ncbi:MULTISPECIES: hypothetical protein [Pseudomonas]|uniref:hypothetical protein n=1 Tax=Pseudomonas TaxID=286 RepID=UPI001F2F50FC|nr:MULTISPECIES: hypothetical protein [Pseudomonas]WNZ87276.1 hypothetical protein QOM10_30465 [Pseudomonas sp. P108]